MGEGKRRFRWLSFGSYALKGARRLKAASTKEQRAEIVRVAKDPEAWGQSLTEGWDLVKDESLDLKDAFLTVYKIQLGRRTSKKERRNAVKKFALAGTFIPPLRVFSIPGSEMILGVAAFVMPLRIIPDRFLPSILRSTNEEEIPTPSKKRLKWFQKERNAVLDSVEEK
ncbi:MAG: hypothetical protein CMA02_02135 [Euryarchaeota archaeon]|nr:hypothetical protein [Euryarchaeota archaeon]|tara:strand:- start:1641 stop:2147 length:507 start_codon:yes stop_codon:yes gene_type:complete